MQKELIDMHVHTRFSDGKYKLEEVLALAHEKGIKKLVIKSFNFLIYFTYAVKLINYPFRIISLKNITNNILR